MALSAGSRLGHFDILGTLGAGGMGVVYRARDTGLQRDVALKILPEAFAGDPERLDRFRREARAVAALNHPNVVTIYSVEEVDGIHFLTMELIEGGTLVDLIPARGLPLEAVLRLAVPLADAISAAHQRSIIHRDLKPANVMLGVDGRVKVLDFGLAKLRQESQDRREPAGVTTEPLTAQQHVLGTPAYMSPEQAEAKPVDARSDIFSLGVMLYEMAAGTRPFHGDSSLAILSSILKDTPAPLAQLRPDLPADVDRIVRRCLAKEPARRFQTALDIRNELEDLQRQLASGTVVTVPAAAPRPRLGSGPRRAIGVVAGLVLVAVAAALVWPPFAGTPGAPPVHAKFDQLTSQPGGELFARLSPDGKWIVYSGEGTGNRDVYLQSVSGRTPINLTADSPADDEHPAFSPDGERIAFRSSRDGGGLFVMGRTGEAVRRITRGGFNPSWSPDGAELVYTTVATELKPQNSEQRGQMMVVAVNGGQPRPVQDNAMMPSWSPRGLRIAFSGGGVLNASGSNILTVIPNGSDVVHVTQDAFLNWNAVWAPDGGHLYFASNRGGSMNIWRVAIDEASGRTRGAPEPITTPAAYATHLSVSSDGGQLLYSSVQETQNIQKLRLDPVKGEALGEPVPVTSGSRFWANPDPSPDGTSVVFYSQVGPEGDLYVARTDGSGSMRQLTDDAALDRVPRWSPDGEWIAMFSNRSGGDVSLHVWRIRPDGSDLQRVTRLPSSVAAWSPDGRRLATTTAGQGRDSSGPSASIVDVPGASAPVDLPRLPAPNGRFPFATNSWSPDGRRIAGQYGFTTLGIVVYSLEAQRFEHLLDFGEWPVWLPDSRRILFVSRAREFHLLDTATKTTRVIFSVVRDTLGPPRLTRDAREAYFSRRITEADVWIATLR